MSINIRIHKRQRKEGFSYQPELIDITGLDGQRFEKYLMPLGTIKSRDLSNEMRLASFWINIEERLAGLMRERKITKSDADKVKGKLEAKIRRPAIVNAAIPRPDEKRLATIAAMEKYRLA